MAKESKEDTKPVEDTKPKKRPAALHTGEAKVETVLLDDPVEQPKSVPDCFVDGCPRKARYAVKSVKGGDPRHVCAQHRGVGVSSFGERVTVTKV